MTGITTYISIIQGILMVPILQSEDTDRQTGLKKKSRPNHL
jgi:hypothetical protein